MVLYICNKCNKNFSRKQSYQAHINRKYSCILTENFSESEEGMLIFRRLNNSLIKKYKIGSFITLDNNEFKLLFKLDNVVRIIVPSKHSVRIIYKEKDSESVNDFSK
jgi:hypothetical protein